MKKGKELMEKEEYLYYEKIFEKVTELYKCQLYLLMDMRRLLGRKKEE
jgi:hypothetical protein